MELLNLLGEKPVSKFSLEAFVQMLSPFAPHLSEELWERLGNEPSVGLAPWPNFDPALVVDDVVTVVIQISGKKRGAIDVDPSISDSELQREVVAAMQGTQYEVLPSDKFIIVRKPGSTAPRLVNVVATR